MVIIFSPNLAVGYRKDYSTASSLKWPDNPVGLVRDQPIGLCPYWAQILKHTALNSRPESCILMALLHIHRITVHISLTHVLTMHFP